MRASASQLARLRRSIASICTEARLLIDEGHRDDAARVMGAAIAAAPTSTGWLALLRVEHAGNLRALQRHADAERELLLAHDTFAANAAGPQLGEVCGELAVLYAEWGRETDAVAWRARRDECRRDAMLHSGGQ
jgi:hypothetical protein